MIKFYDDLAAIYAAIRAYKEQPFDETKRQAQAEQLLYTSHAEPALNSAML